MNAPSPSIRSLLASTLLALLLSTGATAAPHVDLEIVTAKGLPPATAHQWMKTLADLGISGIRIRPGTPNDQTKIEETGTKQRPAFRVVALLNANGTLQVPGGTFTQRDGVKIAAWLKELGNNGAVGVTESKAAYGLTQQQLEDVITDLSQPLTFSTKGLRPREIANRIVDMLKIPITVEPNAKAAIAAGTPVDEEFQGLASGTVLAILLRTHGATLNPQKPDGQPVRYLVKLGGTEADAWPIGWPPEDPPGKFIPRLFEFLNAEIDGVSAAEALAALEGRLEVPMVLDHAAIARHRVDLKKEVSVPAKKTYYQNVLQKILSQVDLKHEVRVDENGKPIFWITTIKK